MSDILDVASDYIEASTNAAIQKIRQSIQGQGASRCVECDTEIPLARRDFLPNTKHCIDCAAHMEEMTKRHRTR